MPQAESAVQVAVRVRPFNSREKNLNAQLAIDMSGPTTYVYQNGVDAPEGEGEMRQYGFDYSLWSHWMGYPDQVAGDNPDRPDRKNVDQDLLYADIGIKLLNNFWGENNEGGFDVCMFAYGQSGSGKSFSMTGAGPDCALKLQGIIPRISRDVFQRTRSIGDNDPNIEFKITASMLEIYVDKIYDLLIPANEYNIATRPHLDMQMSNVKGLSQCPVNSERDVTALLVRGFQNQYKAPTGLNVDSSRGHTVFALTVDQIITGTKKGKPYKQTIKKVMQLVDLAGSERSEKMLSITKEQLQELLNKKAESDGGHAPKVTDKYLARYKEERKAEGTAINTSLSTLGKCVELVAKFASISDAKKRKKKMGQISWRSSQLTRLLRPALSGQSKTIMIAAVSPSTSEYDETLSTMRYADNIKKIPSTAKAKEREYSAEEKMKQQIEELKAQLLAAQENGGNEKTEHKEVVDNSAEMKEMMAAMEEIKRQNAETEAREAKMAAQMAKLRAEEEKRNAQKEVCHLLLMTSNPMTSGLFPAAVPDGQTITAGQKDEKVDIKLRGTGVCPFHCSFTNADGQVTLKKTDGKAAVSVNGEVISENRVLNHNDRVRLAAENYYRFIDPLALDQLTPDEIEADDTKYTFEWIKEEAMSTLLKQFEQEDQNLADVQERADKLKAELEKREAEFKQQLAEMTAAMKSNSEHFDDELHDVEEKMRQQAEIGNKAREAEFKAQLDKLISEKSRREAEQKAQLERRKKEEREYAEMVIRENQKQEQFRATQKAQIRYDLLDVLPCIDQCNQFARHLHQNVTYKASIVSIRSTGGASGAQVKVDLIDNVTKAVESWTVAEFRTRFAHMSQEYQDNFLLCSNGEPPNLSAFTSFRVNKDSVQTIGYATVILKAIYLNIDFEAEVAILSNTSGKRCGMISIGLTPIWSTPEQEVESLSADDLHGMKSLEFLDLEVNVKSCRDLPKNLASDVRCRYSFPDFISCALLPDDYKDRELGFTELEDLKQRGGTFETPVNDDSADKLILSPEINYRRVVRVFDMSYKVREWFKNADLMIEVLGEPPASAISGENTTIVQNVEVVDSDADGMDEDLLIANSRRDRKRKRGGVMENTPVTSTVMTRLNLVHSRLVDTRSVLDEALEAKRKMEIRLKQRTTQVADLDIQLDEEKKKTADLARRLAELEAAMGAGGTAAGNAQCSNACTVM